MYFGFWIENESNIYVYYAFQLSHGRQGRRPQILYMYTYQMLKTNSCMSRGKGEDKVNLLYVHICMHFGLCIEMETTSHNPVRSLVAGKGTKQ